LAKRGPLVSTQKTEMMVNLDVDGYTKTLNYRTIIRKIKKQQPTENQNNTKTEI